MRSNWSFTSIIVRKLIVCKHHHKRSFSRANALVCKHCHDQTDDSRDLHRDRYSRSFMQHHHKWTSLIMPPQYSSHWTKTVGFYVISWRTSWSFLDNQSSEKSRHFCAMNILSWVWLMTCQGNLVRGDVGWEDKGCPPSRGYYNSDLLFQRDRKVYRHRLCKIEVEGKYKYLSYVMSSLI